MKALFRVDVSEKVGMGHLRRCLNLAKGFKDANFEVIFVCDDNGVDYKRAINNDYSLMLCGFYAHNDVEKLNNIICCHKPDLVILDGYKFDYEYQKKIILNGAILVCVSWENDFRTTADIVLNQNIWASEDLYRDKTPGHTLLLLGTKYALLSEIYRNNQTNAYDKVENILLTFGGSRSSLFGYEVYKLLKDLPYTFHLVLGAVGANDLNSDSDNLIIHKNKQGLYDLMFETDIAICAAGFTVYELCCLGVPFITYSLSLNQVTNAEALASYGASVNAGWYAHMQKEQLTKQFTRLTSNRCERVNMNHKGKSLVDGYGVDRVVREIQIMLRQRPRM